MFGRLDRLTREHSSAGLATLAGSHPDITPVPIMPPVPGPVLPPAPAVLIDHRSGGNVIGQQAPGTATTEDIGERAEDLAFRICLGPPPGFGWEDQMCNQAPCSVTLVGRVWFARCHAPMFADVVGPGQSC